MRDIMLDLETLGTKPGSVILSIGARAFDPDAGRLGEGFYTIITAASCEAAGLTADLSTIHWWNQQSEEARAVLLAALDPTKSVPLTSALLNFAGFIDDQCAAVGEEARPMIWGNGSDFDNVLLSVAYERSRLLRPWRYSENRCYRTLKNLRVDVPLDRQGIAHNALDDATSQAAHALSVFLALRQDK